MTDQELIRAAADAIDASWYGNGIQVAIENPNGPRKKRVRIEVAHDRYEFDVYVKRQVNIAGAARIAEGLSEEERRRFIVVTGHVQPAVADVLRKRHVNYADAAGNCHIERPPLLLHIEGRKPNHPRGTAPVRAFKGEGLKVVFALLLHPELASRSYRDLVELSGASHGVVQYTIQDLDRLGFIIRLNRTKRRLLRMPDLLDRWAVAYTEHLRPKLSMGLFRFMSEGRIRNWQGIRLNTVQARWGGEPAAAVATNYLKPARLTVYTRETRPQVMKRLRVVPDDEGAIEVIRTFWPQYLEEEVKDGFHDATTPDVLTYADLLASGDPRNAEVAALLRERMVGEDDHR